MARLFGGLYQLFANRRLVIFPHEQLRREALALVVKTVGGRLKVVESSSVHQDHVVALGGAADLIDMQDTGPMVITRQEWSVRSRLDPNLNPYEQISDNPFLSWSLDPD
jgi:hypothetical protein